MTRAEIVGRDTELDVVSGFLERSADGQRALVLEGEAGIGKSTLWLRSLDLARERGFRVLSNRPAEAEQDLAFAGLGDLFEDCLDDVLPALAPPRRRALEIALRLESTESALDPRALGVAVRSALELLGTTQPVLLAIDDVQWLDGPSADALAFALRRTTSPLHVLYARRLAERVWSSELAMPLPPSVEHLRVGPLSAGALQTVIRAQFDRALPRPSLLRVHEMSGGNPFYALEIARALPHELDPSLPLPVPETLDELVRARIGGVPAASRPALLLLSAVGEADMATLRNAGAEEALEAAISHGVVERAGERLRFTHPLLASSVYLTADEAARRSCHAALAELVDDPIERARHLALSTAEPDPAIAAALDVAGDLAFAQGATRTVVTLRGHALRLTDPQAQEEVDSRAIALLQARSAVGEPASVLQPIAAEILERATAGVPRARALLVAADVAEDHRTAVALRREAIHEARDDRALQAGIHRMLAWDARFLEGLEASELHAQECLALAAEIGDERLRASGLVVLSAIRLHLGKPDALRLGDEGYAIVSATAESEQFVWDTLTFSSTLIWAFQLERAQTMLEHLDREWSPRDETWAHQTMWRRGCIEYSAGRLETAAELAEGALEIVEAFDAADIPGLWLVADVAFSRGDVDRAQTQIRRARESAHLTPWFVPYVEAVLGRLAMWNGDLGAAIEHFSRAEELRAVGSLEPNLASWRGDYVEALLQVGRIEDAESLLGSWEADAVQVGRTVVLAHVTRGRGLVAAARGDVPAATELLETAASEHAAVGDPLGRARALLALGVVRRRARERIAARAAIEEAVAVFERCGAAGWAQRARSELMRIGGRTRAEGLTPAERRVAALVADGRTNREVAAALFLGERTVETHLTHIYAKLAVRSRTELARALMSADGAQGSGVSAIST